MVLSKMEYGCSVYASASRWTLKKLDQVQANDLRPALGAFRTSPYAAPYAEACTPQLEYRRNYLLSNHYSKIHTLPSHPVRDISFEEKHEHQNHNQRRSRQSVARIKHLISELEEPTPNVYTFQPWLLENRKYI
ncbi:hypothetical protein JTB14_008424 [Gonioctena quinquepunctata]|nr:hypothetical protein JTB14_008424 [Gonioctena quinquepunctata]